MPVLAAPACFATGNLAVQGLGRATCACRRLREICEEEDLWVSLWEGPLPGGFRTGGKATHAALWLLVKGIPEQVGRNSYVHPYSVFDAEVIRFQAGYYDFSIPRVRTVLSAVC